MSQSSYARFPVSPARRRPAVHRALRLTPVASALAALLVAGGMALPGAARAGNGAWFATPQGPNSPAMQPAGARLQGVVPGQSAAARQQAQARQQLQRSLDNVNRSAAAIAAAQSAQAAARTAAQATTSDVPDGYVQGGVWDRDAAGNVLAWTGANRPVVSRNGASHTLSIQQTQPRAILNWDTFNVGRNTTVQFEQQASDAVLNRVVGADARPSQIQGALQGRGTVMVVNQNGVVFSGTSQVNVRNLVAAAASITDEQFTAQGIYSPQSFGTYTPSFTDALGAVRVEAGARIATQIPGTVTQGGGYVLLLGSDASNAGNIATPRGQALLAAGETFTIRRGVGTDTNLYSTTRGNEVVAQPGATSGTAANTGLIQSAEGDITLTGRTVLQDGVAVSTTTVNNRGTIHLSTPAGDARGSVTLGSGSTTAILLDDSGGTALDSQRDALILASAQQDQARRKAVADIFTNLSRQDDRRDLSRIEIVSGSTVQFADGSMTLATGGQVSASAGAAGRSTLANGSIVDVSGAVGVQVAMEANNIQINVQGNEQRDAPGARDAKNLNNSDVWVDRRTLVHVLAGVGGYDKERWYTGGGLLEVGGYVDLQPHRIGEWAAQGGSVTFDGGEVVTQQGSVINLSGGTLDVQSGKIHMSWMRGAEGRLYEVSTAPGDIVYQGLYKGYEDTHARWGDDATRYFYNPVLAPTRRNEPGYTVGRDAGKLIVSTTSAVLEGDLITDTYQGARQDGAASGDWDGYIQSQTALARGAQLILGKYRTAYNTDAKNGPVGVFHNLSAAQQQILFGMPEAIADTLMPPSPAAGGSDGASSGSGEPSRAPLPEDRRNTAYLDSADVNRWKLGAIIAVAGDGITVDDALQVSPGGSIELHARRIDVDADLTARAGRIELGNMLTTVSDTGVANLQVLSASGTDRPLVGVGADVTLDTHGFWSNLAGDPDDFRFLPFKNGGSVAILHSGDVTLAQGSAIDVSSGAVLKADGPLDGGAGGDVTLSAGYLTQQSVGAAQQDGQLTLGAEIRGYGVAGGGTLNMESNGIIVIGTDANANANANAGADAAMRQPPETAVITLDTGLFQSGFAHYRVSGYDGAEVAEGTVLDVAMPVLRANRDGLRAIATGADPLAALSQWLPPLYLEDPQHAVLTQRAGASLSLSAGRQTGAGQAPLTIGRGAVVSVDPGQAISLHSEGQLTIEGRLNAWGGSITLASMPFSPSYAPGRSVWIGGDAVLDVAGRAYVAHDAWGRAYGVAPDGGSITAGQSDAYLIIRPGALLDASGAQATVDAQAGGPATAASQPLLLAGSGGSIELHSDSGIVLDGTLRAAAGGAGAGGGSLALYLDDRMYFQGQDAVDASLNQLYTITVTQHGAPSGLAGDLAPGERDAALVFGQAAISADQVAAGGFDALTLSARDRILFDGDLDLALGRSLNLRRGMLTVAGATPDAQVHLAAPYIRLDGGSWSPRASETPHFTPGLINPTPGRAPGGASFLALSADLIDIYGKVVSGAASQQGEGTLGSSASVNLDGFAAIRLASRGDVRLAGGLNSVGNIEVDAAQIYPMSGQYGAIIAGTRAGGIAPDSVLTIRSSTGQVPDVPYSVFGELALMGGTVDQGGVVRAPLGSVSLNSTGGNRGTDWQTGVLMLNIGGQAVGPASVVILRNGSLTSVSGAGLAIPYGGTVDGVTYDGIGKSGREYTQYGLAETTVARGDTTGSKDADNGVLVAGITIDAGQLVGEAGAVIDLSGGGELRGEGFVSGRGGSVNVLKTPLANANPAVRGFSQPDDGVYAILPGYASDYAPVLRANDKGAGDPDVGRQITIAAGVPGLPAGTYTLLPASFALLPGAYRVELGGHAPLRQPAGATAAPNGSWVTTAMQSTAGTGTRDALATQILLTPGTAVRNYTQFNETSFSQFLVQQADTFNALRSRLPEDGKLLLLQLRANSDVSDPLQFAGMVRFGGATTAQATGMAGTMTVTSGNALLEIRSPDAAATPGTVSISDTSLNAFAASTLMLGGMWHYFDGASTGGDSARIYFGSDGVEHPGVAVRGGATLRAGQVFLVGNDIAVDGGAAVDTRGFDNTVIDSTLSYVYANGLKSVPNGYEIAVLAVANGRLDFLPSVGQSRIEIADGASLLTEGTIAFAAPGGLQLGEVDLGARYLQIAQDQINIGTSDSLAAAGMAGALQPGWQLTQAVLDKLLRPSAADGVPALERLTLTAGGAFNYYGSVTLDTGDSPVQMVFATPAFYGWGGSDDVVRIATANFLWSGVSTGDGSTGNPFLSHAPAGVRPGGPGTGAGQLVIDARTVTFGYDTLSQPQRQIALDRLALGFAGVTIDASDRITANNANTLTVGGTQAGDGTRSGGGLALRTPLLTGANGSTMTYTAGGSLSVARPDGAAAADVPAVASLGASLTLQGRDVAIDTAVALPSGRLVVEADGNVALGEGAQIDLSGRTVQFFDVTKYSWGGDVSLTSRAGGITQAAGSRIDVSAAHSDAGTLAANAGQGAVALGGTLAGSGGGVDKDGTRYEDGRFGLTAGTLGDDAFAALNAQLNDAGFYGARSFAVENGSLTVRDGVRAHQVNISVDGGSLTVDGTIDASGDRVGTIYLSARDDLNLSGRAVLDAHGNVLAVDSYGAPIDASNRARISLTAANGTVRLGAGSTMDLATPDGVARGHVEINAPRTGETSGDVRIEAGGPLTIRGAASIAVNAFQTYQPPGADGTVKQDNGDAGGSPVGADGVIGLDQIDARNTQFIAAAWNNGGLTGANGRLAGLMAYGTAFHLRPGVELRATGDLTVEGDLDLSGFRYGPHADPAQRGSGEPGVLWLRAGGDLNIHGNINDGFGLPPGSPDSALFADLLPPGTGLQSDFLVPASGLILGTNTQFNNFGTLDFDIPLPDFMTLVLSDTDPLPADVVLGGFEFLSNELLPGVAIAAPIILPDGTVYAAGTSTDAIIAQIGLNLPPGTTLKAGMNNIAGSFSIYGMMPVVNTIWPAGASLSFFESGFGLGVPVNVPAGATVPAGTWVASAQAQVGDKPVWALAPMLAPGSQSWSMRLVAGSNLTSADSRAVRAERGAGNLVLNDPYLVNLDGHGVGTPTAGISVVRTGTGDLELYAAGDYTQQTPYGVYTAGTAVAGTTGRDSVWNAPRELQLDGTALGADVLDRSYLDAINDQRMWYTTDGGDFTLAVGGNITGHEDSMSEMVGNWLWRQGGAEIGQATGWGINFGTYSLDGAGLGAEKLGLAAYSGMGALGGGNATVRAGGDIGADGSAQHSIVVAVGASGRVIDGAVQQTGGGSLSVQAGGRIYGGEYDGLRGDTGLRAGSVGIVKLDDYGVSMQDDPRRLDNHIAYSAQSRGGANFAPGDGAVSVRTLGDLVMGSVMDPGRAAERVETLASLAGGQAINAATWFLLWTGDTAIDLYSAGGNASPLGSGASQSATSYLPSTLRVVATGGSIYYAPRSGGIGADFLLPSPTGQLELLAADRISGGTYNNSSNNGGVFGLVGAPAWTLTTPLTPAWRTAPASPYDPSPLAASNYWASNSSIDGLLYGGIYGVGYSVYGDRYGGGGGTPFMYGSFNRVDDSMEGDGTPSHIYALGGDIQNVQFGNLRTAGSLTDGIVLTQYAASKPVRMIAGGDIINSGGLFAHGSADDVSMMAAGGNIFFTSATGLSIVGPGTLEVSAGGDIYLGNGANFTSVGPVATGDKRPGADIVVQAGLGAGAPGVGRTDFDGFARRYLDPANQADLSPGHPLADQPGKVAKTYDAELAQWLGERFGYTGGTAADALAVFLALPAEQQRIFVRQVFYAELLAGGREYNDAASPRLGSYLRGREAIAALFPESDAQGRTIVRSGDLTMFQGTITNAGIRTIAGGDIQTLTPGGQTVIGVEGVTPAVGTNSVTGQPYPPVGLLTQGEGDIRMYSQGSVQLGLSRIMTTFGGGIQVWSAEGDINAGRGSKTSQVYTPPRLVYDDLGNVTLSPNVPSTGAGIATLNPIPEVPPGDVDLIAPLGTIDAGEAGIRVSGNINIAALQVVNAANIQVQGESKGIPVAAVVNTGALTSASAAATSAATAAQDAVARSRAASQKALPSVISVQILGFGGEPAAPAPAAPAPRRDPVSYRPDGMVQVVDRSALSAEEREHFGM
ncbi:Heme:hemopexin utilization protein A [Bordetella ansorpii]|uniref:Heme:hemopexin utilization protein A n=1 Tax=Bordetella ansorpii TaxID=288768 RepID=A0A157RPC2_9BORD|nr:filamentous haemagglutinin family protein [Bordetella ansorpii]SAI59289.1 Heme:hemopexin utilization protein A [Bordetella ansorpii]